jgi:hypothetical protein
VFDRRVWDLIKRSPSVFGPVLLNKVPGFEDIDISALGQDATDPGEAGGDGPPIMKPTTDAQTGMELPRTAVPGFVSDIGTLTRTLAVAADSALERACEKAGARLVAKTTKLPEIRERLRSAPKSMALELVSAKELASVARLEDLFVDAWGVLGQKVSTWVSGYLTDVGVDALAASDQAALVSSVLCAALNEFTLENAHLGFRPGANRLRVPDALVLRSLGVVLASQQQPVLVGS